MSPARSLSGDDVRVSSRQVVDVSVRTLRTHGLPYAAARAAADVVEELEAVDSSGLHALAAALQRPVVEPTVTETGLNAHGAGGLLVVEAAVDLLCLSGAVDIVDVGEPSALLSALRRVVADRGGSWSAQWSAQWSAADGSAPGGCAVRADGSACLWGPAPAPQQMAPTRTVRIRAEEPVQHAVGVADAANALVVARESGLVVDSACWEPLSAAAQAFLVVVPAG
ncbi:hypothetical protein BH24ACT12_BH24ACT12_16200 [soil metagenome]